MDARRTNQQETAKGLAINRPRVRQLLDNYIQVLTSVGFHCDLALKCYEHRRTAEQMLARWEGGCSEDSLKDALRIEYRLLLASKFLGREAEEIGAAFGEACHRLGVVIELKQA